MSKGFTILELLVASLLLSLMVTVLTMVFNQTSIAWRTGAADVAELGDTRASLGDFHDVEDDVLPGLGEVGRQAGASDNRKIAYRTVSLFKGWDGRGPISSNAERKNGNCIGRLYDEIQMNSWSDDQIQDARKGAQYNNLGNAKLRKGSAYLVGVWSAGPDRDFGTKEDNISTLPEK